MSVTTASGKSRWSATCPDVSMVLTCGNLPQPAPLRRNRHACESFRPSPRRSAPFAPGSVPASYFSIIASLYAAVFRLGRPRAVRLGRPAPSRSVLHV